MDKKEIKQWVLDAIAKGYDRSDVIDLLTSQVEEGMLPKEDFDSVIEKFDDEKAEIEKTKIGYFARRKLKKGIAKVKKMVTETSKEVAKLTSQTKALNKKEIAKLEELRQQMIVAIVGDRAKEKEGLTNVFEVTDEKTGKPISKEILQTYSIKELEELLEELLEALEREI